jgi:transposase
VADAPCERHQVFELPAIRPHVTEYQRYAGVCTDCGQRWEGTLPAGVPRGQFGPGVLALIALLAGEYHLSTRQIQRLFQEGFHLNMGIGTVSQAQAPVSAALAAVVTEAQGTVRQAKVVNVDETGHRQGVKRQWLWVAGSATQSVFRIDPHRNQAAVKALLGTDCAGTIGSDRHCAYGWVAPTHRQLCWAHLLRDFHRMAERSGSAGDIGAELLAYGRALFVLWHRWHDGLLSRAQFEQFMSLLRQVVKLTLTAGAHCGHPATEHTCQNLLELEEALWTFVNTPGVDPTNNAAERALRGYVIRRKLSFGSQSTRGNQFIERVSTVVATCRQQGRAVLAYLHNAIAAFLFGCPALPLVPVPES